MGSRDPATPFALRAYADVGEQLRYDPLYIADIRQLADDWDAYREEHGEGDPDAGPHRPDDPAVVNRIPATGGTVKFRDAKGNK